MLTWVIYPPHFDERNKYPTLLYCQGGPQNALSQFWSYRWNFQMMAANDYIIVAPNRRGVPGFGQEWKEQISGDYGGQNMQDLLAPSMRCRKNLMLTKTILALSAQAMADLPFTGWPGIMKTVLRLLSLMMACLTWKAPTSKPKNCGSRILITAALSGIRTIQSPRRLMPILLTGLSINGTPRS